MGSDARRTLANAPPPVVVGGTGGSGTRAVHGLLQGLGVFMGSRLNEAGDAIDFFDWLEETINPVLEHTRSPAYDAADLPPALRERAFAGLEAALGAFAAGLPPGAAPWGWKNPRSIFLLPLLAERFPGLRFIHMLRDGRDMAYSANQNQPQKHYAALFGEPRRDHGPLDAIRLWQEVNLAIAGWGERRLGPRYLRLRLEDLCAAPQAAVDAVARFTGAGEGAARAALARGIQPPASLGRWRSQPAAGMAEVAAAGARGLAHFGYAG